MFRIILLALSVSTLLFAASTLHEEGITLGKVRLFSASLQDQKIEVAVMRLGKEKENRTLIGFVYPGSNYHKHYYIYRKSCETQACHKYFYTKIASKEINLIAYDTHRGEEFELILPGMKYPKPLHYDAQASAKHSSKNLYQAYLSFSRKEMPFDLSKAYLLQSFAKFQTACHSKAIITLHQNAFKKAHAQARYAAGSFYFNRLSRLCEEMPYRNYFGKLTRFDVFPAPKSRNPKIVKTDSMTIYLAPEPNPETAAIESIDRL